MAVGAHCVHGRQVAGRRGPARRVRRVRAATVVLSAALFAPALAAAGQVHAAPLGTFVPAWARDPFAPPVAVFGATGATPRQGALSEEVLDEIARDVVPAAYTAERAELPPGRLGIPGVVLRAYHRAADSLAASQPGCHVPWWLLAGIGKVESSHAEGGAVDADGNTLRPILGPVLDGSGGVAAIADTDNGRWDGNATWDRAVGPMQFLPSTWRRWSSGNPNNVNDAALAAGRYLCAGGRDLSDAAQRAQAVFSYNHSDDYVRLVLAWAHAYSDGVRSLPPGAVIPAAVSRAGTGTPGAASGADATPPAKTGTPPPGTTPSAPTTASEGTPTRPTPPAKTGSGDEPTTATPTSSSGMSTATPPPCTTTTSATTTSTTATSTTVPTATGGADDTDTTCSPGSAE